MAPNGIPTPCDKGSYSVGGTKAAPNATCTPCNPGFSTQEDESIAADECTVCQAGYGKVPGQDAACYTCDYNTFASGGAKAGDACVACASGSVSRRRATQVQQCYQATIDVRNDVFNVQDEAKWVDQANSDPNDCSGICVASATCLMYKFVGETGKGKCYIYAAAAAADVTVQVGFKIGNGDDYSVWGTSETVGALVSKPAAADEAACMAACSASAECEAYNWIAGASDKCVLTKSELEQDTVSMFQVRGERLASDKTIV